MKRLRDIKIRTKLILSFLLLTSIPLASIGVFSFESARGTLQERVGLFSQELIKQTMVNLNSLIRNIEKRSGIIFVSPDAQRIMSKFEYDSFLEQRKDQNRLKEILISVFAPNNDLSGIALFKMNGEATLTGNIMIDEGDDKRPMTLDDLKNSDFYEVLNVVSEGVWITGFNDDYENIYYMRRFVNTESGKGVGILVFSMKTLIFDRVYQDIELEDYGDVMLVNSEGRMFSRSDQAEKGQKLPERYLTAITRRDDGLFSLDRNMIVFAKTTNDWILTAIVPEESLLNDIFEMGRTSFLITLIVAVIALVSGIIISLSISSPLNHFMDIMKKVETGNLSVRTKIKSNNEFGQLSSSFNTMISQLKEFNESLEFKVQERTQELVDKNKQITEQKNKLSETLDELRATQEYLVESEKMSALGRLVAGVAHEINTPIGVAVTAASFLSDNSRELKRLYEDKKMKQSDFEQFLHTLSVSSTAILRNLERASKLIQGFKQVAVDQTNEERRSFNLKVYIDEVLMSLHPKLKVTNIDVEVVCPDELEVYSYPGAFSQIITNFVMNSILHAFEEKEKGSIVIDIIEEDDQLVMEYRDNGRGMPEHIVKKIYDPFFTTKMGQGGSGLGMNIVYNLVTQRMEGTVKCSSSPGKGTTFTIRVPIV